MDKIEVFNALRSIRIFIFTIFCCTVSSITWAQSLIVSSGSANNFLITYPANVVTTPPSGMMVTFKSNQASLGGICNLNVNSTGSFPIRKFITQNLAVGDIQAGHFVTVIFDGAVWHMLSNGSQPLAAASQWTTSGVNIYYNGGNIGIGTSIPGQALVVVGNSSATGIGYLGTIIGNNLTGAAGSIITVDGFGKLGLGTLTGGALTGGGQANGLAYYTGASTLASNANTLSWNGTIMSISGVRLYVFKSGLNSNVAIGNDVANTGFTGADNNIFGYQAAYSITAGSRNNIMGYQAGNGITIGASNNIFGYQAGYLNLGGNYNNFLGYQAGYTNTTNGQYNNFLGYTAGYYNTTGVANNYLGDNAGGSYSTGSWNNMIGYQAGFYGGNSNNTGNYNNFFGYNAGSTNVSGSNNIAIGYQADMSTAGLSNAVSIGSYAVAGANYVMALGGTGANAVKVGIGTSLPNQSLSVIGSSSITGVGFFGTIIGNNLAGSPGFVVTVDGAGKLGIGTNGPLGPAGGDLINNYPGPTVAKLQGYNVSATAPSNGQILYYNGANWLPGSVGGDLSGSYPALSVTKLQGYSVSATAPSSGQMLYYSGINWSPGSPGGDLTGSYPNPTIAAGVITGAKIAAGAVNLTSQVTGILPLANGGTGSSTAYTSGLVLFAGVSGVHSASSNLFWDNTNLRLGIGTNTPSYAIDINGGYFHTTFNTSTLPLSSSGLAISWNKSGGGAEVNMYNVYDSAVNSFLFSQKTGSSTSIDLMIIKGNGNVGIGNTSPNALLQITGNSNITQFIVQGSAAQTNTNPLIKLQNSVGTDLMWISSGDQSDVFIGFQAGSASTGSNQSNTFIGYGAGKSNTTANSNVFVGNSAGINASASNAGNNTFVGQGAGASHTTNGYNDFFGCFAGHANISGYSNSFLGEFSGQNNTTGYQNVFVGGGAGGTNTTGFSNVAVGNGANVASANLTNASAFGQGASVSASNKVRLGNTSITVVEGQVAYTNSSDARFKENVKEDIKGLDFIMKLRPVSYNFNRLSMAKHIHEKTEGREAELQELYKIRSTGFLAQEIEQLIKDTHFDAFDAVHAPANEHDNYSLSYSHFVIPLVKAVQEQQFMIDSLINQATQLKTSLDLIGSFNKKALQKLSLSKEDGKSKITILEQYISKLELQMTKLSTENTGLKNEIEDIKKHLGIGIVSKK